MTKPDALIVYCPGLKEGIAQHTMRDFCWNCAPFWEKVPLCPEHKVKLTTTGWCKACRKHYNWEGLI